MNLQSYTEYERYATENDAALAQYNTHAVKDKEHKKMWCYNHDKWEYKTLYNSYLFLGTCTTNSTEYDGRCPRGVLNTSNGK